MKELRAKYVAKVCYNNTEDKKYWIDFYRTIGYKHIRTDVFNVGLGMIKLIFESKY